MRRRIYRAFAVWMILQILLPFTAPFPVCDLADILGGSGQTSHSAGPASSTVPVAEGAYAYAPPLTTTGGRLKLVLVPALDRTEIPALAMAMVRSVMPPPGSYLSSQVDVLVLRL